MDGAGGHGQDINHAGRGDVVLAVTAATMALATVFVFFRMISRWGIVGKVGLDDYFMMLAWVIAFGLSFAICYGVKFGLGRHQQTLTVHEIEVLSRLEYTFSVLYNPALMATKTSILVFFLNLSKVDKMLKWSTIVTLAVVNIAGLALSFLNIFQCRDMSNLFLLHRPPSASCTDIITLYLASAPINIITDLAILLLPLPVLKGMNLPRKQKMILHITFGFGVFVTAVDVVRISYLQQATETILKNSQQSTHQQGMAGFQAQQNTDFSWYASLSFMWSAVEVNVGIMCACVPALKPLVSRFMPTLLRDSNDLHSSQESSKPTLNTDDMAAAHRVPSMPLDSPSTEKRMNVADEDREMSFNDFLASSAYDYPSPIERTQTAMTNMTRLTRTPTHFDFVTMHSQKPLVEMSNKESIRPIAEVTVLFFLWGFAYGLLNTLNVRFENIAHMSPAQSTALHSAYYTGYFLGPLTFGRVILKRWGFKACYMIGLMVYGTGTLIFWPSAVLTSFVAFLFSNFIVGLGLSTLEIAANPFTALCGPAEYAEIRLNLSQGVQAIGTLVSPLLAEKALFNDVLNAPSLIDVQWTYLALTFFTYILAFVYYCLQVPEVTDDQLEEAAVRTHYESLPTLRKTHTIWITLGIAAFAMFCYLGAQESVSTTLSPYLRSVSPGADQSNYEAIGHAVFAFSRFIAAGAGFFVKPRILLAFFLGGCIIFSALAMNFTDYTAGAMVLCVYFFEGPLFALIFAMPLRALGKYSKDGSALLTAAIGGGALFPAVQYAVASARSNDYQYAYCVTVATFAFAAVLPLYVNLSPLARLQLDPFKRDEHGRRGSLVHAPKSVATRGLFHMKNKKAGGSEGAEAANSEHLESTSGSS